MSYWTLIGRPVKGHGIDYTVPHNGTGQEYAIDTLNTGSSGRLQQVRVKADESAATGLPDCVKKVIRRHAQ